MASMNLRRSLVSAAVATALGIAGTHAGAVSYQGAFDPDSFSGTFTINVDDDCLTSSGFHSNAGIGFNPTDGICTASLTSASALVTSDSPAYFPSGPAGTLTFAPPAITSSSMLFGINVVSGPNGYTLDSLDSALIPYVSATPYGPGTPNFWLQFRTGLLANCYPNCYGDFFEAAASPGDDPLPRGVYLYSNFNNSGNFSQQAVYTSITRVGAVPEPGTLALIGGALGGGWLARRRKKPKSPD